MGNLDIIKMNKSRVLCCVTVLLCYTAVFAQQKNFIAVSLTGQCEMESANKWVPLKVGTVLTPETVLRNSGQPEAELQVVELETGNSYKVGILHNTLSVKTMSDDVDGVFESGSPVSFVRFVIQVALEKSSDVHFVRNYSGITSRGDSNLLAEDVDCLVYSLSKGNPMSFQYLRKVTTDYTVTCERAKNGLILRNDSDCPLYFIVYSVKQSQEGEELVPVFGDDTLLIRANTQRFEAVNIPYDSWLLLLAYEKAVDPQTLKSTLYNAEGAVPAVKPVSPVGIFTAD